MEVTVNGRPHALHEGATLADLLAALAVEPQAVATAVNGLFVARARRAAYTLRAGDRVDCIQPITGG